MTLNVNVSLFIMNPLTLVLFPLISYMAVNVLFLWLSLIGMSLISAFMIWGNNTF